MYQNLPLRFARMLCLVVLMLSLGMVLVPFGVAGGAGLPDGRAYELVSPPDKNGGSVVADTTRTRAAADGSAVGFAALTAFSDPLGTGIATDYVAVRDPEGAAGAQNGWATHAITPYQSGTTYDGVLNTLEPLYVGEFTRDLTSGVFFAQSPVTTDPFTAGVPNLYLRSDLLTSGAGIYALITACPACAASGRALPALALTQNGILASKMRPFLVGISADGGQVLFESREPLTADTPLAANRVEVYEWDHGTVSLGGRVPPSGTSECDDVTQAPACVASGFSIAGMSAGASIGAYQLVMHALSDGTDGHTRVIFTRPTAADGDTLDPNSLTGQLFMRTDEKQTVQINASERTTADATAPATYLDASANGERVFFMTAQALTEDAPVGGLQKIYMYDVTKPVGSRLTFLTPDGEPGDGTGQADGMLGASTDGHYAYLLVNGQLVSGQPLLGSNAGIYLWHDGTLRYIGQAPNTGATFQSELLTDGTNPTLNARQARVTPDGRHLLFSAGSGVGLTGYDHGMCTAGEPGCRELYVYSADTGNLACVSCNPSGSAATAMASDQVRAINGASQTSLHQNEAITDDGSRVFFSTAEALVPEDVNGRSDAYEYDVATRTIHLLSTGTSTDDSWFMDASASGDDAFFVTDQPLVGWDRDQAYDLYDARVGGGWSEPPTEADGCAGDACRALQSMAPWVQSNASASFSGPGDLEQAFKPRPVQCRTGFVKKRVRGKTTCVKKPRPKRARARKSPKARAKRARVTAKHGRVAKRGRS